MGASHKTTFLLFPFLTAVMETIKISYIGENMFGSLGIWEILLIVLIVALLFGGKKLPELGKGLGDGIKNFKNSLKKDDGESEEENKKSDNEKDN